MPSTNEGITTPEPEEDVNTSAGFEAAMAARGIEREPGESETTDTNVEAGLTTDDQPRDEHGKFAPTASEEEPPGDPEIEALLAKYDGDVNKAMKGFAEAQKLIGAKAQGAEDADQLRIELAELRGALNAVQASQAPPAPAEAFSQEQVEELAMEMIGSTSYNDAATRAANIALETGDERLYDVIIDTWAMESMSKAQRHIANFEAWKIKQELQVPPDPVSALKASMEKIAGERGVETMGLVNTYLGQAMAEAEPALGRMIESEDAETREFGLRVAADRALLLAAKNGGGNTAPAVPSTGLTPAAQRKLAGASVATGALSPPGMSPTATPQTRTEAIAAFKREIMETDTTSVADGLTYGPAH